MDRPSYVSRWEISGWPLGAGSSSRPGPEVVFPSTVGVLSRQEVGGGAVSRPSGVILPDDGGPSVLGAIGRCAADLRLGSPWLRFVEGRSGRLGSRGLVWPVRTGAAAMAVQARVSQWLSLSRHSVSLPGLPVRSAGRHTEVGPLGALVLCADRSGPVRVWRWPSGWAGLGRSGTCVGTATVSLDWCGLPASALCSRPDEVLLAAGFLRDRARSPPSGWPSSARGTHSASRSCVRLLGTPPACVFRGLSGRNDLCGFAGPGARAGGPSRCQWVHLAQPLGLVLHDLRRAACDPSISTGSSSGSSSASLSASSEIVRVPWRLERVLGRRGVRGPADAVAVAGCGDTALAPCTWLAWVAGPGGGPVEGYDVRVGHGCDRGSISRSGSSSSSDGGGVVSVGPDVLLPRPPEHGVVTTGLFPFAAPAGAGGHLHLAACGSDAVVRVYDIRSPDSVLTTIALRGLLRDFAAASAGTTRKWLSAVRSQRGWVPGSLSTAARVDAWLGTRAVEARIGTLCERMPGQLGRMAALWAYARPTYSAHHWPRAVRVDRGPGEAGLACGLQNGQTFLWFSLTAAVHGQADDATAVLAWHDPVPPVALAPTAAAARALQHPPARGALAKAPDWLAPTPPHRARCPGVLWARPAQNTLSCIASDPIRDGWIRTTALGIQQEGRAGPPPHAGPPRLLTLHWAATDRRATPCCSVAPHPTRPCFLITRANGALEIWYHARHGPS